MGQKVSWSEKQWRLWWSVVVAVGKTKCRSALSTIWASAGLYGFRDQRLAHLLLLFFHILTFPWHFLVSSRIVPMSCCPLIAFVLLVLVMLFIVQMVWGYSQSQIVSIPVFQGWELSSTHWVLLNCCPSLSPLPLKALRNVCIQMKYPRKYRGERIV